MSFILRRASKTANILIDCRSAYASRVNNHYVGPGSERLIGVGGGCSPPPWRSDVQLLGDGERVVHLDAEIADRALQLGVAEQELDRSEVASAPVYQGYLGPS